MSRDKTQKTGGTCKCKNASIQIVGSALRFQHSFNAYKCRSGARSRTDIRAAIKTFVKRRKNIERNCDKTLTFITAHTVSMLGGTYLKQKNIP